MDTPTPTQPPRRGALLSLLPWPALLGSLLWVGCALVEGNRWQPIYFAEQLFCHFLSYLGVCKDSIPCRPWTFPRSWTRPANHRRRGHVRTRRALPSEPAMPSGLPPEDRRLQPPARSHCDSHRITAYPSGPRPATSFSSVLRFPVTRDEDCHFFPPKPLPPPPPPFPCLGGLSWWGILLALRCRHFPRRGQSAGGNYGDFRAFFRTGGGGRPLSRCFFSFFVVFPLS